jgi:hypothetical protein
MFHEIWPESFTQLFQFVYKVIATRIGEKKSFKQNVMQLFRVPDSLARPKLHLKKYL